MNRFFPRVNNLEPGSRSAWLVVDQTRGSSGNEDAIALCGDACDAQMIADALNALVVSKPKASDVLTPGQVEVARLMVTGETTKAIANVLGITPFRVHHQIALMAEALGVQGRQRVLLKLLEMDLG